MKTFKSTVCSKYIIAIIEKDEFKKGSEYYKTFYKTFDKSNYKKVIPALTSLDSYRAPKI